MNRPRAEGWARAKAQQNRALRAPPMCRWPVGDGANRVTMGRDGVGSAMGCKVRDGGAPESRATRCGQFGRLVASCGNARTRIAVHHPGCMGVVERCNGFVEPES